MSGKKRFEAGHREILLRTVFAYAEAKRPMPQWVTTALRDISWRAMNGEIESWEDVFGKPWGRGQRRTALTRRRQLELYWRIRTLHEKEGASVNNELFERVGKDFGLSRSVASRFYYEVEHLKNGRRKDD